MALKDLNTINLLLLDRKLHSKTPFFKRRKTGETGDLALPGILQGKNPQTNCWVFVLFLIFSIHFICFKIQNAIWFSSDTE